LLPGHVYVARPDYHLEVEDSVVRVLRGPWENSHRPAVDMLFRSVAQWWDPRAIAIVLSGALDDGTAGLTAVRRSGGLALVQDPHEAVVPGVPLAAIEAGAADEQLSTAAIAARVVDVCTRPVEPAVPEGRNNRPSRTPGVNSSPYAMQHVGEEQVPPNARPAGFVCPDCGGAMFEGGDTPLTLRCRVGHAWSAEALHGANSRQFEEALWAALRILEEDRALQHRLADRARTHERPLSLGRIERRIGERTRLIELPRSVINERAVGDIDRLDDASGVGEAIAETHG
jgi:two-component system chemotaxis response regulator CheB